VSIGRADYVAALPRKVAAAGALITNADGHILVVKPGYKEGWELPGGCVEQGESAREACSRELKEELALTVPVGRLLVVEHQTVSDDKGDSIMFVYDAGSLASTDDVTLAAGELEEARFVERSRLGELLPSRQARRMAAALRARHAATVIELVDGEMQPA